MTYFSVTDSDTSLVTTGAVPHPLTQNPTSSGWVKFSIICFLISAYEWISLVFTQDLILAANFYFGTSWHICCKLNPQLKLWVKGALQAGSWILEAVEILEETWLLEEGYKNYPVVAVTFDLW